ncbi:prolyl aminopeptidase [Paracoccaceae bacterium GXU_MW_L88]
MRESATATAPIYPNIEPYDRRSVDVGDGHHLYVEQSGNPNGIPVLTLHGGPGAGATALMRRFFDPKHYRVVLFDQRGAGRSRPNGSIKANTTQHLIQDIETIRAEVGLPPAIVFGGSWGATLALAYAQAHPEAVRHLVLRGTFLGTQREIEWLYHGGAGKFFPQDFARFLSPVAGADDPVKAYHPILAGDGAEARKAASLWVGWESRTASLTARTSLATESDHILSFARIENHYFVNDCFLSESQLVHDLPKIAHIPTDLVHGRYDMVCPPVASEILMQGMEKAQLHMIEDAGHTMTEPGIANKLTEVMNRLRSVYR